MLCIDYGNLIGQLALTFQGPVFLVVAKMQGAFFYLVSIRFHCIEGCNRMQWKI